MNEAYIKEKYKYIDNSDGKDDGMEHSKRGYVNKSQAASVILFFVLQLKEERTRL